MVVSTHLENISQIGSFPQVGMKIKNIWNHHLVSHSSNLLRSEGVVILSSSCDHLPDSGAAKEICWKHTLDIQGHRGAEVRYDWIPKIYLKTIPNLRRYIRLDVDRDGKKPSWNLKIHKFPPFGRIYFFETCSKHRRWKIQVGPLPPNKNGDWWPSLETNFCCPLKKGKGHQKEMNHLPTTPDHLAKWNNISPRFPWNSQGFP